MKQAPRERCVRGDLRAPPELQGRGEIWEWGANWGHLVCDGAEVSYRSTERTLGIRVSLGIM